MSLEPRATEPSLTAAKRGATTRQSPLRTSEISVADPTPASCIPQRDTHLSLIIRTMRPSGSTTRKCHQYLPSRGISIPGVSTHFLVGVIGYCR